MATITNSTRLNCTMIPSIASFQTVLPIVLTVAIFAGDANSILADSAPVGASETGAKFNSNERLRVLIETDAGGDPDDEQSLVRFLLYTNEWDVEGIICNRATAREGENLNSVRTGLGIVQRQVKAYGECYPHLQTHDARYLRPEDLLRRTVSGYADSEEGLRLIIEAVDSPDPRPVWYCDWGTEPISANNLKRVLDKVWKERGPARYEKFKDRLRIVGHNDTGDKNFLGDHATRISPPFKLWVDTFSPSVDGKRWYHRFSGITAKAGGFDLQRDVLTGHGPLGELYPTNTTHVQKEGDTGTFLYLVPTGMNDPAEPTWGSWAGRYGLIENFKPRHYYWANQPDTWDGTTHRDNSLARWAAHLQNDFRARLDWCVTDFATANHPPLARVKEGLRRTIKSGDTVHLDASESTDPDHNALKFEWLYYPEPGTYRGPAPAVERATSPNAQFTSPQVDSVQTLHIILTVTDDGSPPLARYQHLILSIAPSSP